MIEGVLSRFKTTNIALMHNVLNVLKCIHVPEIITKWKHSSTMKCSEIMTSPQDNRVRNIKHIYKLIKKDKIL